MKHIRKYNESKFDNTDLIHQIIDEITSVFNDGVRLNLLVVDLENHINIV